MQLPKITGQYKINYPLAHLTWFKVGGPAEILFKPQNAADLKNFLSQNQGQLPVWVLAAGSNTLIRDGGVGGVVIKLTKNFTNIELINDSYLAVGSSCLNFNLVKFCLANAIGGFEFLVGIPGTVGGGVIMNAGAYGREFKDIVLAVEVVDSAGIVSIMTGQDIGFKYRDSNLAANLIITRVIFKLIAGRQNIIQALIKEISHHRISTQPMQGFTGGSTFANPAASKAWQLIDKAGLKGYKIGGASVSSKHCNFMINHGGATAADLESLGELIQQRVFASSQIMLEWEIKRVGRY